MRIIVRAKSGVEYHGSIDADCQTIEEVSQTYYDTILNCVQAVCLRMGGWSEIESISFEKEP